MAVDARCRRCLVVGASAPLAFRVDKNTHNMRHWLMRRPRRYYGEPQRSYRGCAIAAILFLLTALMLFGALRARNAGLDLAFLKAKLAVLFPQQPVVGVSPTPPPVAVHTPAPATVVAPTRVQPGLCPPDCDALRAYLVELVNRDRAGQGLAALQWHEAAALAAQAHAEDMLRNQYFSHTALDGSDVGQRLQVAGAGPARTWGENTWTYTSGSLNGQPVVVNDFRPLVEQAEVSWMNSPGHRANLLNDAFSHIGVGIAYSATAGEMRMVQVFLTPMQ